MLTAFLFYNLSVVFPDYFGSSLGINKNTNTSKFKIIKQKEAAHAMATY